MTSAGSVGGDARLRLFLALQLPSPTLDVLVRWGSEQLGGGRIVPPEQLHVTLAFLGHRPADELDAIVRVLRDAVAAVRAPVAFRPERWRETRSAGMVVLSDHGGVAAGLVHRLEIGLATLGGVRPETRPWLPHLTLLRFRTRPHLDPPLPETGTFVPSDAAAYLSRLHPSGARYEVLERVSLIAGAGG